MAVSRYGIERRTNLSAPFAFRRTAERFILNSLGRISTKAGETRTSGPALRLSKYQEGLPETDLALYVRAGGLLLGFFGLLLHPVFERANTFA